jgi:hypothetical protein
MARLIENKTRVEPVSAQLLEVLEDKAGKQARQITDWQLSGGPSAQQMVRFLFFCDHFCWINW